MRLFHTLFLEQLKALAVFHTLLWFLKGFVLACWIFTGLLAIPVILILRFKGWITGARWRRK